VQTNFLISLGTGNMIKAYAGFRGLYGQFFNHQKYLLDLICLGLAFVILDSYPLVPLLRRFINSMAAFLQNPNFFVDRRKILVR